MSHNVAHSKRQPIVTLSSTIAKYRTLVEGTKKPHGLKHHQLSGVFPIMNELKYGVTILVHSRL
jgi:hypothetical protein